MHMSVAPRSRHLTDLRDCETVARDCHHCCVQYAITLPNLGMTRRTRGHTLVHMYRCMCVHVEISMHLRCTCLLLPGPDTHGGLQRIARSPCSSLILSCFARSSNSSTVQTVGVPEESYFIVTRVCAPSMPREDCFKLCVRVTERV